MAGAILHLLPALAWLLTFAEARVIYGASYQHRDPVKTIRNGVKKLIDKANEHAKKMEEAMKTDSGDKLMMDPIEIFRAEMCLHRDALIRHEKCLRWMISVCATKSSGAGSCKALQNYLKNVCIDEGSEQACEFAKNLGVPVEPEPEEVKEEEKEEKVEKEPPAPAEKPPAEAPAEAKAPTSEEVSAPAPAPAEKPAAKAEPPAPAAPAEIKEAAEPAPAPAKPEAPAKVEVTKVEVSAPAPAAPASVKAPAPPAEPYPRENDYSKKERALPDQGYDEHSTHEVEYNDGENHAKDWQKEWPQTRESEAESYKRICADNPNNEWCSENHPPAAKKVEKTWWETIFR